MLNDIFKNFEKQKSGLCVPLRHGSKAVNYSRLALKVKTIPEWCRLLMYKISDLFLNHLVLFLAFVFFIFSLIRTCIQRQIVPWILFFIRMNLLFERTKNSRPVFFLWNCSWLFLVPINLFFYFDKYFSYLTYFSLFKNDLNFLFIIWYK